MPSARDKLFQIIHRLEGDSGLARTDAIERFAQDETLDELVASIERDIAASKPHAALDRLRIRHEEIRPPSGGARRAARPWRDAQRARAGRYFNPLRRSGQIRPISEKIMKSTVETFELYNSIRNNESLAHDNRLVEANEARFIFDSIVNMLRFIKSIEGNRFDP